MKVAVYVTFTASCSDSLVDFMQKSLFTLLLQPLAATVWSTFDESRCLRYFCSLLQRQFGRLYAKVAVYVSLEGAYSDIFVDFLFFSAGSVFVILVRKRGHDLIIQSSGNVVDILLHLEESDDRESVRCRRSALDQGFPVRKRSVEEECVSALF